MSRGWTANVMPPANGSSSFSRTSLPLPSVSRAKISRKFASIAVKAVMNASYFIFSYRSIRSNSIIRSRESTSFFAVRSSTRVATRSHSSMASMFTAPIFFSARSASAIPASIAARSRSVSTSPACSRSAASSARSVRSRSARASICIRVRSIAPERSRACRSSTRISSRIRSRSPCRPASSFENSFWRVSS